MTPKEMIQRAGFVNILCLGNPSIPGDSIGPKVGTLLNKSTSKFCTEIHVVGCVEDPVLGANYSRMIEILKPGIVIVVDAMVTKDVVLVGSFKIEIESIVPGSLLNYAQVPAIGDIAVKCYTGTDIMDLIRYKRSAARHMASMVYHELTELLGFCKNK